MGTLTYPRVTTWQYVDPGDVVRGADGSAWAVVEIEPTRAHFAGSARRAVTLRSELAPANVRAGSVKGSDGVAILRRGRLGLVRDVFAAAGLATKVISYDGTGDEQQ